MQRWKAGENPLQDRGIFARASENVRIVKPLGDIDTFAKIGLQWIRSNLPDWNRIILSAWWDPVKFPGAELYYPFAGYPQ